MRKDEKPCVQGAVCSFARSSQVDNLSNLAHNELMCTHWLWKRAATERVLIFQTDSLICRHGIEDFQMWDYIGAPWREDDLWCVGKPWLTEVCTWLCT